MSESSPPRRVRVIPDHGKCVGSRMCVLLSPDVFKLNEKNQVTVLDVDADTPERVLSAAQQCPMYALKVEDADTGEVLFE